MHQKFNLLFEIYIFKGHGNKTLFIQMKPKGQFYKTKFFVLSKRDSLTVIVFACHAAGPGSNLGEDQKKLPRSFFDYGAVG